MNAVNHQGVCNTVGYPYQYSYPSQYYPYHQIPIYHVTQTLVTSPDYSDKLDKLIKAVEHLVDVLEKRNA